MGTPGQPLAARGQYIDGLPGNGPALDSRHGTGKDPGMTPEERFFPTRGDDELWVHHDALEGRDETPPDAVCHALGVSEGQNIGQGPQAVHGKKGAGSLAAEPRESWSFHLPHGLLAVLCAVLIHGLGLALVWTWIGLGGGGEGPVLMALELSRATDGLEGDSASPGMQKANSFASGESSLLPLLAPNVPHPSVTTAQKPVSSSRSSVVRVQKPIPPSELVQTPLEPVRPESDPSNSVQDQPVRIESDLGDPAVDDTTPEVAATESSGPGRVGEASVSHGGAGEEGHATGAAQSGAHGTGGGAAGTDAGPGSAGGGALLDFGAPGGPEIVRLVRPVYPHEARRLGKEGQVILRLSLQVSGEVEAIEILQTAGFGMDEAACKAACQSRFRPATRGGRPVGCQAILPVRFTLR